jgi:hypothetical protein
VGLVTVLAAAVLAGCGGGADAGSRTDTVPYWEKGVGFTQVAEQLGVTVPQSAMERKGARQKGFQDDALLLAFVLPKGEVDGFVDTLAPENELVHRKKAVASATAYEPTTPFAHLGLPEPETLDDVRTGTVCMPCAGELNELEIVVAPLENDRSRIYLLGVD